LSESITFTKWFWSDKCRDNLSINVYHGIYLEYSFRGESRCLSRVRILCSCWYPLFILYMFHWWKLFQKRAVCTQFDIHCSSYTCLIDESYSRNVPCALNLISTFLFLNRECFLSDFISLVFFSFFFFLSFVTVCSWVWGCCCLLSSSSSYVFTSCSNDVFTSWSNESEQSYVT
jgi:hypothetical protein